MAKPAIGEIIHRIKVKSKVFFESRSPSISFAPWKLSVDNKSIRDPYVPATRKHT